MSNSTNEFQALWQAGNISANAHATRVIQQVREPKRESVRAQVATILILSLVIVILLLFFHYLSPVEEVLSLVGKWSMIGSLLIRIMAEVIGISLARKVDFFDSAAVFVHASRRLVRYRTGVHKGLVVAVFALYSIGYYLLFPEWTLYFSTGILWLLGVSYVFIIAMVLYLFILPGMKREKAALVELERLAEQLDVTSSSVGDA